MERPTLPIGGADVQPVDAGLLESEPPDSGTQLRWETGKLGKGKEFHSICESAIWYRTIHRMSIICRVILRDQLDARDI